MPKYNKVTMHNCFTNTLVNLTIEILDHNVQEILKNDIKKWEKLSFDCMYIETLGKKD